MEEKATIFSYSILSSQLVLALQSVIGGKELGLSERRILEKGRMLLDSIIQGSLLVERKTLPSGVTASIDDVAAYGYALSTFKVLKALGKDQSLTESFTKIRTSLETVLETGKPSQDAKMVQGFFQALEGLFNRDLQKESRLPPQREIR